MNRHVNKADLSAFLDGEARRPARIERHLAACPHCARAYASLRALSDRLHAIEAPEVRSGFRTRVLGHIREQTQPSRTGWSPWRPFGTGMALAAAAAVALITALWAAQPDNAFEPQAPHQTAAVESQTEDAFLASIETPYAEASDTAWMFASAHAQPQQEAESVDELLIALANIEYFDGQFPAEKDINTAVTTLNDTERVTFLRLLTQIAREDAAL